MQSSLAFVIACSLSMWLGWYLRDLRQTIQLVWDDLAKRIKAKEPMQDTAPRSMMVEPREESPGEKAQREQKELLDSLNPPR